MKRTGPLGMAAANHQEHGPHSGPMFLIMMPPPVQRPCFLEAVLPEAVAAELIVRAAHLQCAATKL